MSTNKISVVFCTNGIFPHVVGGMQRHSKLLIDELSTYSNIEITVLHPHEESIFPQKNVREMTIKAMDSSKNYLLERYRYSRRIYEYLQQLPDHIIYSQGPSIWYKAEEFSSRLIVNPHGLEPFQGISFKDQLIGFPFRIILKRLFKKARYVVSLGGRLTDILKPLVKNDDYIAILPNAVSEPDISVHETASDTANHPLRALFVGRFASNKGIHVLMKAIEQLNKNGFKNKIEFHLAGKGPLYKSYKNSNAHSNVHILGFVSDEKLEKLYQRADVFVLPTLFEGMPTVVLEAMSEALPIIVTDVGATAELVSSENGYLVEKNDSAKLQRAMIDFIQSSGQQRKTMGKNSLAKVRNQFTWSKVAKAHYDLFKQLYDELKAS